MSDNKDKSINMLERPVEYEVAGQEVKLTGNIVKNYLTRGNTEVTDQELVMFINLCKYQKLNPFLNEAYLVKFGSGQAQIITSKEAYMKRAFADPNFEGMKAGIIIQRGEETKELEGSFSLPGDTLLGGWAEVYVKGKKHPYVTKIGMDEFEKSQSTWKSMPKTMIRKTALVQALREAFPDNLGAMYTEEEQEVIHGSPEKEEVEREIQTMANQEVIDIEDDEIVEEPQTQGQQQKQPRQETVDDLYQGPGF